MPFLITIAVIVVFVLIVALANIKVVAQSKAYVVERLGKYSTTWETGLHVKVPFIERIAKIISLKEQVVDFAPQAVITKDNVTMKIDTVVFCQITDPKLYCYGVEAPLAAIEILLQQHFVTSSASLSWMLLLLQEIPSTQKYAQFLMKQQIPGESR